MADLCICLCKLAVIFLLLHIHVLVFSFLLTLNALKGKPHEYIFYCGGTPQKHCVVYYFIFIVCIFYVHRPSTQS